MNHLKLTHEKLNLEEIQNLVLDDACGAVSLFIGTTRDNFDDKKVIKLEYEAYDSMALKAKEKICDDMRAKWTDIKHIAIYHRLGVVPIRESSVIIAVSSPHRQASLDAVQYAIDELKRTVPIWKKEIYDNNDEVDNQGQSASVEQISETNQSKRRKKFKNKHEINFDACCPISSSSAIAKDLQQINANDAEIERRVNFFIDRKREEINLNNIQNYREDQNKTDDATDAEMTCSRVCSSAFTAKGSKTHLKVYRVKNEVGPQLNNYTGALEKLMHNTKMRIKNEVDLHCLDERLNNVEDLLRIKPASVHDVFTRLKNIENRLLFLESSSPEYRHFIDYSRGADRVDSPAKVKHQPERTPYSVDDLNELIAKFEKEN